jgi:small subunit ribosomal protein S1
VREGNHDEEHAVSEPTEDFAAMFEASVKAKRIEKGQTIEGTIVAIGPEVAFVDVGGKGEATIEIDELKDADGGLEVAVGDRIQATVVSTMGGLTLSRRLARGAATERQLEDAFHTGLPVEGKVERAVKGGYEVRIARQRAFCPISQIDTSRTDPPAHEGRVYQFRIIEYKEGGRNLVVSRRALLEEEQRASAAEVRRSIAAGAIMTGHVISVRDFGAFVDLGGGVQGLLHVSEMGWSRVSDASQVVRPGQEITVKVLRVGDDKQKISLGLKQLTADPWSRVEATYQVGQVHAGRVTRVAEFGAFVELEPGIEGLAHASTFAPTGRPQGAPAARARIARSAERRSASERGWGPANSEGWSALVAPETTGAFEILSIDLEKKRIGLALVPEGSARAGGTTLSHDAEEVREYAEREDAAASEGFGTLADKLRGALKPREP